VTSGALGEWRCLGSKPDPSVKRMEQNSYSPWNTGKGCLSEVNLFKLTELLKPNHFIEKMKGCFIHLPFCIHGEFGLRTPHVTKTSSDKMALCLHITYAHPPIYFKSSLEYF
jgi:hypothetical protein